MARCFVHIGVPKTGTTYIQRMCWDNRQAFLQAGILYPSAGARRGGHHDYAFLIEGGYPDWATPQPRSLDELEADLAQELQTAPDSSVLLSSEQFYIFPRPEMLLEMLQRTGALRHREPTIILYLRRQDAAQESWYNQTIKALGYSHSIDESIATFRDWWDYDANLQRWSAVFGDDAIRVRLYEEQQFAGGTLAWDFLSAMGLTGLDIRLPAERINTGLNYDLLQVQRSINRLPLSVQRKRRFHKQMIALTLRSRGTGLFNESPAVDAVRAASIMEYYAAGNARVANRYFGRGTLFLEDSKGSEFGQDVPQGITPKKLAHLIGWVLTHNVC